MAMDLTADSRDSPVSAKSIVESAKENLKVPDGFASEHILISGDGSDSADEPTVVGKQIKISNRVRSLRTEFTFFKEGFLKIREFRKNKLVKDYMLELRFLNPQPTTVPQFVARSFWGAVGMAGAAGISWLLTKFTALDAYTFPAFIVFSAGAVLALFRCISQTGEKTHYVTASGRVPALLLLTNFGCLARNRSVVSEISSAIVTARNNNTLEEEPYLRAEMQDHYRLRNEGVITPKACNKGTARILSRFG